jgi:NAD(P)-dependent dehydrogenase (short-subunit alcohol dehydrogenase family)
MTDEGSVVLITGASSGIGKACADYLANHGYVVFAAARSLSEEQPGGGVSAHGWHGIRMDVVDESSVGDGVDRVLRQAGRLDAVVNCAGFGIGGSIEGTSIEEAKAIFETNVFGILRVCRATLPILRKQRSGRIVNVSSLAGRIGLPFQGLYSATKFAIEGLTESLRMEVKAFGIRVSLIEPGDFCTSFTANRRVADDPCDAYGERFERALEAMESDETGGAPPDRVARLLHRILRAPSPRLRYTVGPLSQRVSAIGKPLLPPSFFEREVMKHYNVL